MSTYRPLHDPVGDYDADVSLYALRTAFTEGKQTVKEAYDLLQLLQNSSTIEEYNGYSGQLQIFPRIITLHQRELRHLEVLVTMGVQGGFATFTGDECKRYITDEEILTTSLFRSFNHVLDDIKHHLSTPPPPGLLREKGSIQEVPSPAPTSPSSTPSPPPHEEVSSSDSSSSPSRESSPTTNDSSSESSRETPPPRQKFCSERPTTAQPPRKRGNPSRPRSPSPTPDPSYSSTNRSRSPSQRSRTHYSYTSSAPRPQRAPPSSTSAVFCTFCRQSHPSHQCFVLRGVIERRQFLLRHDRCYRCLGLHPRNECPQGGRRCKRCDADSHHVAVCPDYSIRVVPFHLSDPRN